MRGLARAHGELLFLGLVGAVAQAELWLDATWAESSRSLALIALGMTAALLLRTRLPFVALVLVIVLLEIAAQVDGVDNNDPMAVVIMVMIASYSAGAHARGRSVAGAVLVLAAATLAAMVGDGESMNISGLLFFGLFFFGPFLTGLAIRARRTREGVLVRERDERARAAVAEERGRIARELHDVVAHAISVVVLQARGARHALDHDPPEARRAIDAIERTAAQALAEMRRLLEILRDDDAASLAPQPSLAHLDALTDEVRRAGLAVEVNVEGHARELAAGVDASAYRIVQEALTNVLKHAGRATAVVTVRYLPDEVELEVADDGSGPGGGNGGGHGLIGMRERAAVFGGTVEAGARSEGGYAVRARLPS
jgi:signal transduction histidine kinase